MRWNIVEEQYTQNQLNVSYVNWNYLDVSYMGATPDSTLYTCTYVYVKWFNLKIKPKFGKQRVTETLQEQ